MPGKLNSGDLLQMVEANKICSELDDNEIVEKSLEDLKYFACLYERFGQKLLRYILKISNADYDEASDILQDAFIKVFINLNEFDHDLKLSSWLYRIIHNETISYCRKKRSFGKNKTVNLNDSQLKDYEYQLDETINEEEKTLLTNVLLDSLPLKYKEVLVLRYFEKLSYEEISDVLKIPEGTVSVRINRAKSQLKKFVGKNNILPIQ